MATHYENIVQVKKETRERGKVANHQFTTSTVAFYAGKKSHILRML